MSSPETVVTGEEPGARAPSALRFGFVVVICLIGIAILAALGTWQVERLYWKEGIIATIDARVHATPVDIADVEALAAETGDVDYIPVSVAGTFDHAGERYFLATYGGEAGWHVYTPLQIEGQTAVVFVNRGFVPYDRKDPSTRETGNVVGRVVVTGLARNAGARKPNSFMPDNDPKQNTFFWRSVHDMAAGLSLPAGATVLPFFIDAGVGAAPGGYPIGGVTVIDIPNSHLQYAITWFGLGLVLAVMLLLFVVRSLKARLGRRTA